MKKIAITSVFVFALSCTSLFAQSVAQVNPVHYQPEELYARLNTTELPRVKKANPANVQKHIPVRPLIDKETNAERKMNASAAISVNAFPNPFTSDLIVNIKDIQSTNATYEALLFDLQGRKVFSQELATKNEKLNTNGIASGTYILHIQKNGVTVLQEKVIKQ